MSENDEKMNGKSLAEAEYVRKKVEKARFIGVRIDYDKFEKNFPVGSSDVSEQKDDGICKLKDVWVGRMCAPGTEVPEGLDYLDIESGEYDELKS